MKINMRQPRTRGFTLIELLVVISIIGLLSSVVLASLSSARIKARNAARNSSIEQLRNAFVLGLGVTGTLPDTGGANVCVSATCYQAWASIRPDALINAYLAPYIHRPPDPPGGARGYGGYLYMDPAAWDGAPPDFPPGHYLYWLLEAVPITSGVCGPGQYYSSTGTIIQCLLNLDK